MAILPYGRVPTSLEVRPHLVTRRALGKRTWPGVWTNSCCGHPRPGEPMQAAVVRRVGQELGARVTGIRLLLPDFRYQAVDASGVRENEVCPVFAARFEGTVDPDPGEVMEHRWVDPGALADVAATAPWLLSPWSATQIGLLYPARARSHRVGCPASG